VNGCGAFTDAATRIAYDIEANVDRLAAAEGATLICAPRIVRHAHLFQITSRTHQAA